jgi:hypothetical protein
LSEPEGRAGLTDKLDADARIVQSPRPRESETDRYEGAVPVAVRLNCDNQNRLAPADGTNARAESRCAALARLRGMVARSHVDGRRVVAPR